MSEREKLIEVMAEAICEATNMNRVSRFELEAANAALTALEASGVRLVPVELTDTMADEMECQFSTEGQWKAALAASPYAPEGTRND